MSDTDRYAYVLVDGAWVPKQRATADGGERQTDE